jgi:hypothetical protein
METNLEKITLRYNGENSKLSITNHELDLEK